MSKLQVSRPDPLIPHRPTIDDDVRSDCGHPTDRTCDGCSACVDCDGGCYCGEAEDEPVYLLAS